MALIGGPPPLLSLLAGCVAVRSLVFCGRVVALFRFLCVAALLTWAGVRFVTQRGPCAADPNL